MRRLDVKIREKRDRSSGQKTHMVSGKSSPPPPALVSRVEQAISLIRQLNDVAAVVLFSLSCIPFC